MTSAKLRIASLNFSKFLFNVPAYYLIKISSFALHYSFILCHYYFFIVNNFSMFNIVSNIIFGLIVFFMNTSLPFLYFFYIFFNVLLWIYLLRITLSFLIIFSQYTNVLFQKNYSSFRVLLVSKPKRQLHFIVIDSNIFILIVWCLCGGDKGSRTLDLLLARQAL